MLTFCSPFSAHQIKWQYFYALLHFFFSLSSWQQCCAAAVVTSGRTIDAHYTHSRRNADVVIYIHIRCIWTNRIALCSLSRSHCGADSSTCKNRTYTSHAPPFSLFLSLPLFLFRQSLAGMVDVFCMFLQMSHNKKDIERQYCRNAYAEAGAEACRM